MPRLQGSVRAAGGGAGDSGCPGAAARGGHGGAERRRRYAWSGRLGVSEPWVAPPRPDISRLRQVLFPRRNSCDSWPACCGSCTAQTASSAAGTAGPRCGSPACACACCVRRGLAGMRKWARLQPRGGRALRVEVEPGIPRGRGQNFETSERAGRRWVGSEHWARLRALRWAGLVF